MFSISTHKHAAISCDCIHAQHTAGRSMKLARQKKNLKRMCYYNLRNGSCAMTKCSKSGSIHVMSHSHYRTLCRIHIIIRQARHNFHRSSLCGSCSYASSMFRQPRIGTSFSSADLTSSMSASFSTDSGAGGRSTEFITCTTPFSASRSS